MKKLLAALLLASTSLPALAIGTLAEVNVVDRYSGRFLPTYYHNGSWYVAGKAGGKYEISVRSQYGERLLAVTSVDGINVISGKNASPQQSGYVIDAWGETRVEGWRKNMGEVASFIFSPQGHSYAARTGRADQVGVIGVALFRERAPVQVYRERERLYDRSDAPAASASPAPMQKRRAEAAPIMEDSGRASPGTPLGTAHGNREESQARYTDFQRASSNPDEVITIYYDSYDNLVAMGVIPGRRHPRPQPSPFPGEFVPDPRW